MPKTSPLLALVSCSLVISGLAGCTSSPPIQESQAVSSVASVSSASSALQEQSPKPISMTSSLEEIPVTENLTLDPGQMIQNCHVMDNTLYFLATAPNDLEGVAGFIYRTQTLYAYDLASRALRTIKEMDLAAQEAVLDFFEKDGVLYEAYQTSDDNGWHLHIRIDNQDVWSSQISSTNPTSLFWQPDGSICFLASQMEPDPQMERDLRWGSLNRIKPDHSSEILWDSRNTDQAQILVTAKANDSTTPIVFSTCTQDENGLMDLSTSKLNYFDGQSVQSIPCSQISLLIPLANHALVSIIDSSGELYALKYDDLSLTAVENPSGFMPTHGNGAIGDRFIWGNTEQTHVAQLKDGIVTSVPIDQLPESQSLGAFHVDENIDLLAQYVVSNPESPTITWTYYLYQLPEEVQ